MSEHTCYYTDEASCSFVYAHTYVSTVDPTVWDAEIVSGNTL